MKDKNDCANYKNSFLKLPQIKYGIFLCLIC